MELVEQGRILRQRLHEQRTPGAVAVPLSPLLSKTETERIIARVEPRKFLGERSEFGPHIQITDPEAVSLLPQDEQGKLTTPVGRCGCDPAVVFFTSGTTGEPKGIILSHENLRSNAEWVATRSVAPDTWGPGMVTAAVLPLSHSFAMTCMQNAALFSGAAVSYQARFDAKKLLHRIRKIGITTLALVPTAAKTLLEAWRNAPGPVPLTYFLVGGAPIPSDLAEDLEGSMDLVVLEGYGLTETSPVCAFRTPETPRKSGSVGRAAGFARLAILLDNDLISEMGEGELLVSGPGVMSGYLDQPEQDSEDSAFMEEWFRTGDIVRIDKDGDVVVVDRKKDLIIRNGYNISPVEIERALMDIPGVIDAGVVGVPDTEVGEEIVAYVVVSGEDIDKDYLTISCATTLALYKRPRAFKVVTSIPRGTKGQVLRDRLLAES